MAQRLGMIALGLLAAAVVLIAPVIWQVMRGDQTALPGSSVGAQVPVADALQAEIAALRREVETLRERVDGLDARTAIGLSSATAPGLGGAIAPAQAAIAARVPLADSLKDDFAQVVLIAGRRNANDGLTVASPRFLRDTFGLPGAQLGDECGALTNPRLRNLIATEDVGPIRARLLAPALASLRAVFAEIEAFEPELYARIASSGSLCVRLIRGSASAASAHAYGLAVDLNIDGELDGFADGRTQLGLILLAEFFNKAGWIWGAGFSREDSMHFEVSREKIEEWRSLGLL
ncbi:D-alanyl-D-alanine carboxypeptidase [Roseivivax lentus]|uniref:D-alanyl-D-alanine carboxypeptidase n=1 Tax=Roseivivax lentus TaxID=633194 RepID=A0A1N7NSQ5_9RHOB|nr:M15 family metallopeptidase [Roseivivax lentus]SIT01340.1 D-alanyl-D-alanine carboxypeptidase [Roseivivax lentus]